MNEKQIKLLEIFTLANTQIQNIFLRNYGPSKEEPIRRLKDELRKTMTSCGLEKEDIINFPLDDLVKSVENDVSREYSVFFKDFQDDDQNSDPFKGIIYLEEKTHLKDFFKIYNFLKEISNYEIKVNNLFSDSWHLLFFIAFLDDLRKEKLIKEYFLKVKEKFSHIHLKEELALCKSTFINVTQNLIDLYKNGGDLENFLNADEFLKLMKKNFEESFEWCERDDRDYRRYGFFLDFTGKINDKDMEEKGKIIKIKNELLFKNGIKEIESKRQVTTIIPYFKKLDHFNSYDIKYLISALRQCKINEFELRPNVSNFIEILSFFLKAEKDLFSNHLVKYIESLKSMLVSFSNGFIFWNEMEVFYERSSTKTSIQYFEEKDTKTNDIIQYLMCNILHFK